MLDFNRSKHENKEEMAEARVHVKLTNAVDEVLVNRGLLNPNQLRFIEADALVDTGAVRTILPESSAAAKFKNSRSAVS